MDKVAKVDKIDSHFCQSVVFMLPTILLDSVTVEQRLHLDVLAAQAGRGGAGLALVERVDRGLEVGLLAPQVLDGLVPRRHLGAAVASTIGKIRTVRIL